MKEAIDIKRRRLFGAAAATGLTAQLGLLALFGLHAQAKPAPAQGPLAGLSGATEWINAPALRPEELQGKVVLVNFWTYSCINSLRTLPWLRAWDEKYRDAGLVVIGVHTPEFAFEKRSANVRRAVADLGLRYPVAMDNDFSVWRSFQNRSWPGFHIIDSQGRVRHQVAGEHAYERTEQVLQGLLSEAGRTHGDSASVRPEARGVEAAPDLSALFSGESYLGYQRATDFAPGMRIGRDRDTHYAPAANLRTNQWTLAGSWRLEAERAVVVAPHGRVLHRFRARDVHMVLGPAPGGQPVRFRVLLDGKPPLADHGSDTNAQGEGAVDRQKLYQLVRQAEPAGERLFEIEFLDPGAEAYAFTFG